MRLLELLDSSVFNFRFDFDEWPSIHACDKNEMRAYNYNIFEIRKHYQNIFPEKEFEPIDFESDQGHNLKKVNKISYQVILLPIIGTHYQ